MHKKSAALLLVKVIQDESYSRLKQGRSFLIVCVVKERSKNAMSLSDTTKKGRLKEYIIMCNYKRTFLFCSREFFICSWYNSNSHERFSVFFQKHYNAELGQWEDNTSLTSLLKCKKRKCRRMDRVDPRRNIQRDAICVLL